MPFKKKPTELTDEQKDTLARNIAELLLNTEGLEKDHNQIMGLMDGLNNGRSMCLTLTVLGRLLANGIEAGMPADLMKTVTHNALDFHVDAWIDADIKDLQ